MTVSKADRGLHTVSRSETEKICPAFGLDFRRGKFATV